MQSRVQTLAIELKPKKAGRLVIVGGKITKQVLLTHQTLLDRLSPPGADGNHHRGLIPVLAVWWRL